MMKTSEVRWLSKVACLTRFYLFFESVLEFLESKDPDLKENLIKWKADIAYLTDLFKKFNEINLQLQGDSLNLNCYFSFFWKIEIYEAKYYSARILSFHTCHIACLDEDIKTYVQHLNALHNDFKNRFEEISMMKITPWIINPFNETEVADVVLQEELLELSTNEELKVQLKKGYQRFWLQAEIPEKYPELWEIARKLLIAFPSSYLLEKSFSVVTNLLTKKEQIKHHRTGRFAVNPYKTEAKY
ncbi:unnamed protein product [Diatraea saccharalis]|uniref:SCAN domain-containing protein 3 n=1 Tax=Diatraea saccharalis TaxID=40085 RepID=A0A9N9WE12_9NEOP|nr:unnamed protein product [Diatraea saccharalis]